MRNFILNIEFIRYSPFWWWVRLISHFWFRFDDYHIWKEFWCSLNSGWNDMQYIYEFEKVWDKGVTLYSMVNRNATTKKRITLV